MQIQIIVKWKIQATETGRILDLLPQLIEKTRNEEGNISYNIYQSTDDANILILQECYANAEALEEHKASVHYQETVAAQIIPFLEVREVYSLKKLY
jgi:quinol monooxygenase YgiN